MKQAAVASLKSLWTADYTLVLTLLVLIPCLLEAFTVLQYTPGQVDKPYEKLEDLRADRVTDELRNTEDGDAAAAAKVHNLGRQVDAESGSSEERIVFGDDDDYQMTGQGGQDQDYASHHPIPAMEENDGVYGSRSTLSEADSRLWDRYEAATYRQSDVSDDREYYRNVDIDMFEPVNAGMQDDEYVDEENVL